MGKTVRCKKCGTVLNRKQKYCTNCGTKKDKKFIVRLLLSFIVLFFLCVIFLSTKYSNNPDYSFVGKDGQTYLNEEYSDLIFSNSACVSIVLAAVYSIYKSKFWQSNRIKKTKALFYSLFRSIWHFLVRLAHINRVYAKPDITVQGGPSNSLDYQSPNLPSEDSAYDLIFEAKFLADQVNKSTSIIMFSKFTDDLFCTIDKLIWMNEIGKIEMINPPRAQKKKIERNMEATINDLITRCIEALPVPPEKCPGQIDAMISDINRSGIIQKYMTNSIRDRINNIRADAYRNNHVLTPVPEVNFSSTRSNEHRKNHVLQPDENRKNNNFRYTGIKDNMDFSEFDDMEVILSLERNFEREYNIFTKSKMDYHAGEKILSRLKNACESSSFPLSAEIRLESLFSEYEPKFLRGKFLDDVDTMSGPDFESWCASILEQNGFTKVSVTPGSGDQGVDVLAEKDGVKYAIQCKCYSSDLGNTPVQEVHAGKSFYGCHVGVVMTNRHFTSGAKDLSTATGVMLWDRDKLQEFISASN